MLIGPFLDTFPYVDPASIRLHDGKGLKYNVNYVGDAKLTTFRGELHGAISEFGESIGQVLVAQSEVKLIGVEING